jgi:hypothetical protein
MKNISSLGYMMRNNFSWFVFSEFSLFHLHLNMRISMINIEIH